MQDGSRKETLLDDLCESVGREGVAEVDVGSYHGIGQHHDRRPFLRQVAHEALVARYRAIVTDKPAEAGEFIHPKPVVAYPAESLLLCCCAYHLASSQRLAQICRSWRVEIADPAVQYDDGFQSVASCGRAPGATLTCASCSRPANAFKSAFMASTFVPYR